LRGNLTLLSLLGAAACLATPAVADDFFFSTNDPDGKMATASRPSSTGKIEIESADDFILNAQTNITHATFTGLLTGGDLSNVGDVHLEVYRVFPNDSNTARTPNVPTRMNSPADVAFEERDLGAGDLTFTTTVLNNTFTAANSVLNGIFPKPNQNTKGEGQVTGTEVKFDVNLTTPFDLPADHFFFIPQIEMTNADGEFYWLSAPKPIVAPGTPINPDLQEWIRNENLAPDWLRVGTDIVGGNPAPTFNASFSLSGQTVPEPSAVALFASGAVTLSAFGFRRWRKR
jgi:hypothetical protein